MTKNKYDIYPYALKTLSNEELSEMVQSLDGRIQILEQHIKTICKIMLKERTNEK